MRSASLIVIALAATATHADSKSDFNAARSKWSALAVSDYSFTYLPADDNIVPYPCVPYVIRTIVRNGRVHRSSVVEGSGGCRKGGPVPRYWHPQRTVEELFANVERLLAFPESDVRLSVRYDPGTGVPVYMRAEKLHMTDSNEGFDVRDVVVKP